MNAQTEQVFLHDLSNPLAIAYGNIRILAKKLKQDPQSFSMEDILSRLEASLVAFDQANDKIRTRREMIHAGKV